MKLKVSMLIAASAAVLAAAIAPAVAEEQSFEQALKSGKASLNLRGRYEHVDQDSLAENADALTVRLRLNYKSGDWNAWSGFLEFDHVFEVLVDDFNSGGGTSGTGRSIFPVIADPGGSDLNQLYLQYAPNESWHARIGRQRILLDDQRFVGGVGWRQNEQTFDALSVTYNRSEKARVSYSYIDNANRIFGDEVAAGDHSQHTHLLNGNVGLAGPWNLTGYAYIIDNEDAAVFSTSTLGVRLSGDFEPADGRIKLLAEIATQSDNANNPASYDADYFRVQADWLFENLSAGVGFETLGSDNGQAFRTPLATLHAFNGWADQFLTTPASGLQDAYAKFGFRPGKWNLQFVYHDYSAESGSGSFGSEIDLSAARKIGDEYAVLIKAASFIADDAPFVDTTKFWLMFTASH